MKEKRSELISKIELIHLIEKHNEFEVELATLKEGVFYFRSFDTIKESIENSFKDLKSYFN